jgi:hypothetical protein
MRSRSPLVLLAALLLAPLAAGQAPHPVQLPAGQVVGPLDPDATPTLTVAGLDPGVCFIDDDSSGAYEAGEEVYLDVSSAACAGPAAGNDVRLVAAGKPAGSLIKPGDPEFGTAPGGALNDDLRFVDDDGDGAFGPGDALYLDLMNAGASRVDIGDLRLTALGSLPSLSEVRSGDADVDRPLAELPLAMDAADFGALAYLDVDGDGNFGAADTLYVDLDGPLIFPLLGMDVPVQSDVRLTPLGGSAAGSAVGAQDLDSVAVYRVTGMAGAITGNLCAVDDNSDGIVQPGEELLFDVNSACADKVQPGDVRLANAPLPAGSVVRSADADANSPLIGPVNDDLRFFDADGDGALGPGDTAYVDVNNAAASRVDVGDLRLTPFGTAPGMATVRAGDADVDAALREIGGGVDTADANVLAYLDVVSDGHFSHGDLAYLNVDAGGFPEAPAVGDVRLGGLPPAFAPGSMVHALDPEVRPRLLFAGLSPAACWLDDDADGLDTPGELVVLDIAGTCAKLNPTDLRLTGAQAGSAVRASDGDAFVPLAGPLNGDVRFVDEDGDGAFGAGDTLVLDVVNPGASRVDVGDVRLAGGAPLVLSGDAALDRPLLELPAAQGGARDIGDAGAVGFVDNDADGAYGPGDTLYLHRDLVTAFDQPVSIGDVRLMAAAGLSYLPPTPAPPPGNTTTPASPPECPAPQPQPDGSTAIGDCLPPTGELVAQLAALSAQLNASLAHNAQLQVQVHDLSGQLGDQTATLGTLDRQLQDVRQENAGLQARLASPTPAPKGAPGFEALAALGALGLALLARRKR